MASRLLISFDLPCTQCTYNLRGLTLGGKCPECGELVSESFNKAMAEDPEGCWDVAVALKREWVADAMTAAGYPADAGLFLIGALQSSLAESRRAEDVCNAVRDYAAWYFNDQKEALDLLREWKLRSSEDVGCVQAALADAGLIEVDAEQSAADFAGLFTLENLFPARTPVREAAKSSPGGRILTQDLPCIKCKYNLRGLPLDINCPECGETVRRTWTAASNGLYPGFGRVAAEIAHDWYAQIADAAGITTDGIHFISAAMKFMRRDRRSGRDYGDGIGQHMTAADVCTAVREYANVYFNSPNEARAALEQWKVRSSEDVGKIVFAMVDAGFFKACPDDSIDAFSGLFTFDDLIGDVLEQAEPA